LTEAAFLFEQIAKNKNYRAFCFLKTGFLLKKTKKERIFFGDEKLDYCSPFLA